MITVVFTKIVCVLVKENVVVEHDQKTDICDQN